MRARSGERRYTPTAFFWRNRHTRLPAAKKIVQTRSIDRGSRMTSTQADEPLLSERIRRSLAEAIAAGSLRPGTSLDEQQVDQRFGTSRTPAPEALHPSPTDETAQGRPPHGPVAAAR